MRRVSATCASRASAGWQQVKIRRSRSSGIAVARRAARSSRAPRRARAVRASSAQRSWKRGAPAEPVDRRALRAVGERARRRGWSGTPSRGQLLERRGERLLQRLLGEVEVAEDADQGGERPAPTPRGRAASTRAALRRLGPSDLHDRPHLDRAVRAPGMRAAIAIASSRSLRLDQVVAAELLAGLGERAVGGQRLAVAHPHGGGGGRRLQGVAAELLTALGDRRSKDM